ncbi:MAG: GAF domain-containing protein [Sandaracinus sp.]|nr:GAF domain-containing protein [Sandaracinus sp.]MCB9632257.1 GAF domain-containing protein [Sandaracinus sp.]
MPTAMEILEDPRLDRVFLLPALASANRPLNQVFHALCEEIAAILPAEVVSVYLRESDDEGDVLLMRANVGFPEIAVGNVALPFGEGITGFAAECMRPVIREQAETDAHYRRVDGLDEERFPAFLAWPLVRTGRADGVLVVQRSATHPFSDHDLALVGASATAFHLALAFAEQRRKEASAQRGVAEGREVRLQGHAVAPGESLGRVELLPTLRELAEDQDGDLQGALDAVTRHLERGLGKLELGPEARADVMRARLVLDDARFRSELVREVEARGLAPGLASLARRYALSAERTADGWLADRSAEVAAVCRLVAAQIAHRPLCRPGSALLLAERPGSLIALEAALRRVSAVVVAEPLNENTPSGRILRDAGVPMVADVAGLYDWVRPGDALLVDGDKGLVWVSPSESRIAKLKASR